MLLLQCVRHPKTSRRSPALLRRSRVNLARILPLLAHPSRHSSLLYADRLRHPQLDTTDLIHQFETNYPISILEGFANGLSILTDLGQTVSHAEETLDIARTELEIPALQNLILAETLANRWRSLPERESVELIL